MTNKDHPQLIKLKNFISKFFYNFSKWVCYKNNETYSMLIVKYCKYVIDITIKTI